MAGARDLFNAQLAPVGIVINGPNPWDPQIHTEQVFDRVLAGGSRAAGEAYMDGDWDVPDVAEFFNRLLQTRLHMSLGMSPETLWYFLRAKLVNLQSRARATHVAEAHYDLGHDLYSAMLGPSMVYTCAYWKEAQTLTDAQYQKLDLVCKKIGLKKGDRVLDIGCGFGTFAKFAAEHYGATVVGTSVSKGQIEFAREFTKGLPVEIRFQDYRETNDGPYDHIVSIGMFEAVGYKNFRPFMERAHALLKPNGMFLLHTIGQNVSFAVGDPWIERYIFPNGMLPSVAQIGGSLEGLFVMEDWHNFGPYYDKTLIAWFENFDAAWPSLREKYGDRFYRMWKYYLLMCAGTFRSRQNQLWQIVLSPTGVPGGYTSVR